MMLCCIIFAEEATFEEEAASSCVENDVCEAQHKTCAQISAQSAQSAQSRVTKHVKQANVVLAVQNHLRWHMCDDT